MCDYGFDVGNLHVIDYYLARGGLISTPWPGTECPYSLHRSPADWSRP